MSGRVLIIEDDTRIANWVKVYFERAGFSAEVAHDGETGLELARDLAPDLVILDLTLPRLDGVELCRILRSESDVPIIMLTAREAHADRIIGLDGGADDYIVKPFDPDEVIARAGAVLRRVKGKVQRVLTRGSITLNETTQSVTVDGEPVVLSQAQTALLATLMRHPQPGADQGPADLVDLQRRFRRAGPGHRQPDRPPAPAAEPGWQAAHPDGLRGRLPVRGGGGVMSLRWKIMGATVLVVVLTVIISVGVGYYASQSRLGVFVDRIGGDEAVQLARNLSREYTDTGGWGTVDAALSQAGYAYTGAVGRERAEGRDKEGEHMEAFHRDPVRVVITEVDGRVIRDNFSELSPGTSAPGLEGHRETVFDLNSNQPVGQVYVDVNRELLATESHGFLNTLLYITIVAGALTIGIAILLAAWLSRRITAPVTALTEATQAIAQGDTTRLPVTSSDELGKMSAAFNEMTAALETQRELRRRLINDVSHELNTPLSVILLEARGLLDGLQTPGEASGNIVQEVNRLRGLVTDLNWLAETDQGEMRLNLEASPVHELLEEEVERWQPQAQARQVELSLETSGGLPCLALDRMRMSQALGNVIGNAVHCTGDGGHIAVRATVESGEVLAISITDDGIGIDAADLPHIFDRFYRTGQSRSHGIGGTGLGLAITRAIVEGHGGTLTVESGGPGLGATVNILLPLNG